MAFLVKTGSSRLSGEKNFKWTFCFFVPKEVLHAKGKTVLSLPIFSFSRLSGRCLSVVPVWFVFSARHETMAGRFSRSRICGTGCRCVVRLPDCFVNNCCCYPAGCFLGLWLGKTQTDPGGGQTHSGWIIWTIIFALGIFFGFLTDWILQKKNISKQRPDFQSGLCFDIWLS